MAGAKIGWSNSQPFNGEGMMYYDSKINFLNQFSINVKSHETQFFQPHLTHSLGFSLTIWPLEVCRGIGKQGLSKLASTSQSNTASSTERKKWISDYIQVKLWDIITPTHDLTSTTVWINHRCSWTMKEKLRHRQNCWYKPSCQLHIVSKAGPWE